MEQRTGVAGPADATRPAVGDVSDGAAAAGGGARVVSSECTMCLDCLVACPTPGAMRLGRAAAPGPWQSYDPGRRAFVLLMAVVYLLIFMPWVWRIGPAY